MSLALAPPGEGPVEWGVGPVGWEAVSGVWLAPGGNL